mmetsp:Transcript_24465/g.33524  ORF Transcript_24465/g.33524 Transcript_24465/m.33524 type:complete len:163 (-) Transcript_24465:52-540(-)|eukprot:CAMPEP_0170062800 /NCGR_PEP_ID=MMETSP0019_2-20121128/3897_1 /TAXON_ID=98059 /ORGANISM="Dinobryon sp., Strain UTEXLB2267" /LENGTH=162 /DNA_ID=CAMNT_0010269051 /DNA_START=93 /DNA_END=581 /DNA_ORIENTATION=-
MLRRLLGSNPKKIQKGNDIRSFNLQQLQELINNTIISNPWDDDETLDDSTKLATTIQAMREKGYRPITAQEYFAQLRKSSGISLWMKITSIADGLDPAENYGLDENGYAVMIDSEFTGGGPKLKLHSLREDAPAYISSVTTSTNESCAITEEWNSIQRTMKK